MAGRRSAEQLRFVAAMWLMLGVSYVPWIGGIVSMARHGAQFTVGTWTLATPFLIAAVAPVAALLVFRNKTTSGSLLLAVLAADRILYEGVSQRFLALTEGYPFAILQLLLSIVTVVVAIRECVWRKTSAERVDRG